VSHARGCFLLGLPVDLLRRHTGNPGAMLSALAEPCRGVDARSLLAVR
jgi:hypothetical protein